MGFEPHITCMPSVARRPLDYPAHRPLDHWVLAITKVTLRRACSKPNPNGIPNHNPAMVMIAFGSMPDSSSLALTLTNA